jgi:hypothetical protein
MCSSSPSALWWNRTFVHYEKLRLDPLADALQKACRPPFAVISYSLSLLPLIGAFLLFPPPLSSGLSAFFATLGFSFRPLPSRLPAASTMSRRPEQELEQKPKGISRRLILAAYTCTLNLPCTAFPHRILPAHGGTAHRRTAHARRTPTGSPFVVRA